MNADGLMDYLIAEKISSLTFGSAREYINKLCKLLNIQKKEIEHLIKPYIEMKARRDVGVHNNWMKDSRYQRRISELNIPDTGEEYLKPNLSYFSCTHNICGELVKVICNSVSVSVLNEDKLFQDVE